MQDAENKCGEQAGTEGEITGKINNDKRGVMYQMKKIRDLQNLSNLLNKMK